MKRDYIKVFWIEDKECYGILYYEDDLMLLDEQGYPIAGYFNEGEEIMDILEIFNPTLSL